MKRASKRRLFARLGMLAVGAGALAALCFLYLRPLRVPRPMFPRPAAPGRGAAEPEAAEQGVSAEQILLADASERLGAAAPPESAALLAEAGGAAYIADLTNRVPTSTNAVYYAEIIRTASMKRG